MKQSLREHYLSAMGIQTWVSVAAEPLPESPGAVSDVPGAAGDACVDIAALDWDGLASAVTSCRACALHETRHQTAFARGDREAELMVIGEAPGEEEDQLGEPFTGSSGRMLDAMLRAIGYARGEVCIVNILKCRPPEGRDPHVDEMAACRTHLNRQIELVQPEMILTVGRVAAHALLGVDGPLSGLRGEVHTLAGTEIPLVATYHPAYLMRAPSEKRHVWQDLLRARSELRMRQAGGDDPSV